jgi:hypothetical protein
MPLPALDGAWRLCPRRSRRWRGPGWGGIGATRPTGATKHDGGDVLEAFLAYFGNP